MSEPFRSALEEVYLREYHCARRQFIFSACRAVLFGALTLACLFIGVGLLGRSAEDWDTINEVRARWDLCLSATSLCTFVLCSCSSGLLRDRLLITWDKYLEKKEIAERPHVGHLL
jgi:hypothetical protein